MKKKIVYIAHPVSGDTKENLQEIRRIYKHLSLLRKDIVPFAPYYVSVVALDDKIPHERYTGMQHNTALFERGAIDEVWLYGSRISEGMKAEILLAKRLKIPVVAMGEHMHFELIRVLDECKNLPEMQENMH